MIGFAVLALAAALMPVNEQAVAKLVRDAKGKPLVVNFWATWCGPCRTEMPGLLALQRRMPGMQLLLISADEPEEWTAVEKFLTSVKAPGPWYIKQATNDDAFINSFDPKWSGALPATFVYDRTGKRVRSFIGEVSAEDLAAVVSKL